MISYRLCGSWNLGIQVKNARNSAGLTQEKLSELCEVSHVVIIKIERGIGGDIKSLIKICDALGLEVCIGNKK